MEEDEETLTKEEGHVCDGIGTDVKGRGQD